ncbi:MAG: hypothetical protein ABJH08_01335 [Balneola sp.]
MNNLEIISQLEELKDHIETLTSQLVDVTSGEVSRTSLKIYLSHLMEHINVAWHYSKLSDEEIHNLDQEAYERISSSIPKLSPYFKLVEPNDKVT